MREHVAGLNRRLGQPYMPTVPADFGCGHQGQEVNLASMEDACRVELARAKIDANEIADRIQANMQALVAAGDAAHFPDAATLVLKLPDDLRAIIAQRAAEGERKLEAERERIRAEEQAKAQREAAAQEAVRAAAAAQAERQAEAARKAAEPAPVAAPAAPAVVPFVKPAPAEASGPATLNVGDICRRLGFTMTAAFISDTLGIKPTMTDKAAIKFREADFARICAALQRHIAAAYEKHAA
jgi:hypothetical protein